MRHMSQHLRKKHNIESIFIKDDIEEGKADKRNIIIEIRQRMIKFLQNIKNNKIITNHHYEPLRDITFDIKHALIINVHR